MQIRSCLSLLLVIACLTIGAGLAEDANDTQTSTVAPTNLREDARLIYNEAVDLYNTDRKKEALPKLKRVIELAPEFAPTYSVYGSGLMHERQYSEALSILKKATELAPDWTCWYNLGVCYQHLGDIPNMANAFKNAVKVSPDHPEAAEVQKTIKFLEAQIGDPDELAGSRTTPDYLGSMENQGFVRWLPEKMPLRVFIKDGSAVPNFRPEMVQILKKAFDEWSNASERRLKFKFETDEAVAQIVCSWTADPRDLPFPGEAGHAVPMILGNTIDSASVLLSTVTASDGDPISEEEMYSACLHELGHVLGLWHSPNPQDVMFLSLTGGTVLSSRDRKTIIGLYTMDKARLESKPFDISRGVQAGAEPSVDMEVLRLGNAAAQDLSKNNYKEAQEKLNKALQLKPGDDFILRNLCIAYYNEATHCVGQKDLTKAEQLLVRARDLCKGPKLTDILKSILLQYSPVLKALGKAQEAKTVDSEIAKLNPVARPVP